MKSFKRNKISLSLSLLAMSGHCLAANFDINQANLNNVDVNKYECKRCEKPDDYKGFVNVSSGYTDSDDIHAGNALGTSDKGAFGAVSSEFNYQGSTGYQASLTAHQLGMDNGFSRLSVGKSGLYTLDIDYSELKTNQAGDINIESYPSAINDQFDLALMRKKVGLSFDYGHDFYKVFTGYNIENKTGRQSSSLLAPTAINVGLPVDMVTQQWNAGMSLNGDNWLSEISYLGNSFHNNTDDLLEPNVGGVYAASPDSIAHHLSLSGQYNLGSTVVNGRFMTGRMIQDESLIEGFPLQNWEGEVNTLDGHLAVTSMVNNRLRVGGSAEYSKRNNESDIAAFNQYNLSTVTGKLRQNIPQDIERNTYKLNAAYRFANGYRLQAGYDLKEVERSSGDREQTNDDNMWVKLKLNVLDNLNIKLKAEHATRDGSKYEASELTSSEDNGLMRKYYLADRTRNGGEIQINHNPFEWLGIGLTTRYAKDEYDETLIGLTESEDYGYDLNMSVNFNSHVNGYGSVSQQWITSAQAGSESFSSPDWVDDIEDEFINIATGMSIGGLMQDKLTLGLDYQFSNSVSDTYVTTDALLKSQYGDYFSYNHSAKIYADYALSNQIALKMSYRYERYYDTDGAVIGVNEIPGLVTLGDINHNYNAHQVMLSFTYQLR